MYLKYPENKIWKVVFELTLREFCDAMWVSVRTVINYGAPGICHIFEQGHVGR